jgi:hypothetical protein
MDVALTTVAIQNFEAFCSITSSVTCNSAVNLRPEAVSQHECHKSDAQLRNRWLG